MTTQPKATPSVLTVNILRFGRRTGLPTNSNIWGRDSDTTVSVHLTNHKVVNFKGYHDSRLLLPVSPVNPFMVKIGASTTPEILKQTVNKALENKTQPIQSEINVNDVAEIAKSGVRDRKSYLGWSSDKLVLTGLVAATGLSVYAFFFKGVFPSPDAIPGTREAILIGSAVFAVGAGFLSAFEFCEKKFHTAVSELLQFRSVAKSYFKQLGIAQAAQKIADEIIKPEHA